MLRWPRNLCALAHSQKPEVPWHAACLQYRGTNPCAVVADSDVWCLLAVGHFGPSVTGGSVPPWART
jgi:hypothetical protein